MTAICRSKISERVIFKELQSKIEVWAESGHDSPYIILEYPDTEPNDAYFLAVCEAIRFFKRNEQSWKTIIVTNNVVFKWVFSQYSGANERCQRADSWLRSNVYYLKIKRK